MADTIPYTYAVGWTKLDKWYYGVSYRKGCNPDQLWNTYFTSSKSVQEFRKTHGEPDIIRVRKTFLMAEEAIKWEQKVLKKLKIFKNKKWLNKGIGMPSFKGLRHTEETKEKMRKPKPNNFGEKIKNVHTGAKRTKETCIRIKESKIGTTSRAKHWCFEYNGNLIEIFNLKNYCKDNGLNVSCMRDVYYGKQSQHNNYRKVRS